jgi:hypothetical protein
MTVAYDRRYELTLAKPLASQFFGFLPNALVIRGMEIKFKVERSLESSPNTAEVSVYNLSDSSRAEFQRRPLHVSLDVGYAGSQSVARPPLSRLLSGDLMFASTKRTGPDIITTFVIGDGERSYVDARVNLSFGSGTNLKTAIASVAGSMGLTMPSNAASAKEFLKQFSGGMSVRGPSRDAMSKLVAGSGFGWSTQDGQLQLLRDADTRPGLVELISARTGLIDSPNFGAPKKPGDPPVLTFRALLRPQLIPGGRVKIESAEINGVFRLSKVTHTGDFRDNDWYSECEGNPV